MNEVQHGRGVTSTCRSFNIRIVILNTECMMLPITSAAAGTTRWLRSEHMIEETHEAEGDAGARTRGPISRLSSGRPLHVSTGRYVFYPRIAAPGTGTDDLEWIEASGLGTIYSITVNRTRRGSYNIALVQLDEGPRLMSRIEGVETAPVGTRVKARIADLGEPAIVFDIVPEEDGA